MKKYINCKCVKMCHLNGKYWNNIKCRKVLIKFNLERIQKFQRSYNYTKLVTKMMKMQIKYEQCTEKKSLLGVLYVIV